MVSGIQSVCDNPTDRDNRLLLEMGNQVSADQFITKEEHLVHDYMQAHPEGEQRFLYGYLDYMSWKGKHLNRMIMQDAYRIKYVEFTNQPHIQYRYSSKKNVKNKLVDVVSLFSLSHFRNSVVTQFVEVYAEQIELISLLPVCSDPGCKEKFKLDDRFCKFHGPLVSIKRENSFVFVVQ